MKREREKHKMNEQNTKVHHSYKAIRFGDHSPANLIVCGERGEKEKEKKKKEEREERRREILIPKKGKLNKHETFGQALELCHKPRPSKHYDYVFYQLLKKHKTVHYKEPN